MTEFTQILKNITNTAFMETEFPNDSGCILVDFDGDTPTAAIESFCPKGMEFDDYLVVRTEKNLFPDHFLHKMYLPEMEQVVSVTAVLNDWRSVPKNRHRELMEAAARSPHVQKVYSLHENSDIETPLYRRNTEAPLVPLSLFYAQG